MPMASLENCAWPSKNLLSVHCMCHATPVVTKAITGVRLCCVRPLCSKVCAGSFAGLFMSLKNFANRVIVVFSSPVVTVVAAGSDWLSGNASCSVSKVRNDKNLLYGPFRSCCWQDARRSCIGFWAVADSSALGILSLDSDYID